MSLATRFDYFLIWGNGLAHREGILAMLRAQPGFEIVKIQEHKPKGIKRLVRAIYSYDYAPFHHLRAKTKYLLKTSAEVVFIFLKNLQPLENYFGEGDFRHVECERVKALKEEIRNRYNERKADRRSENHVIHASDNESQTDHILKYLGYSEGTDLFRRSEQSMIRAPYHLPIIRSAMISKTPFDRLLCRFMVGTKESFVGKMGPVTESPQYKSLEGGMQIYEDYLRTFLGGPLQDDYSVARFERLAKTLEYPDQGGDYVITRRLSDGNLLILDGLHRASIMKHRGAAEVLVAIVP